MVDKPQKLDKNVSDCNEKIAPETSTLDTSANETDVKKQIKAVIYIYPSPEGNPSVNIQEQVQACKRFIDEKHWTLSDTFIEEKESESMIPLIRSRAMSEAFDYVVSFVNCTPVNCSNRHTGVIVCIPYEVEFYFKEDLVKGH